MAAGISQRLLAPVFKVKREIKQKDRYLAIGVPVKGPAFWKFLHGFLREPSREAAKLVVYEPSSATVITTWRLRFGQDFIIEVTENGLPSLEEPEIVEEPEEGEVDPQTGLIGPVVNAKDVRMTQGLPREGLDWKAKAIDLLIGGAIEVAKVYAPHEKGLQYFWRVLLPVEKKSDLPQVDDDTPVAGVTSGVELQPPSVTPQQLSPAPKPKAGMPDVKFKKGARTLSGKKAEDLQKALPRWKTKAGPQFRPADAPNIAGTNAAQAEYRERLKNELVLDSEGRVVKMPIFNNYASVRERMMFGRVTAEGAPSGASLPTPSDSGVILSIPQAWKGSGEGGEG